MNWELWLIEFSDRSALPDPGYRRTHSARQMQRRDISDDLIVSNSFFCAALNGPYRSDWEKRSESTECKKIRHNGIDGMGPSTQGALRGL